MEQGVHSCAVRSLKVGDRVVGERGQVVRAPKRAFARVAVFAVRPKSPGACVLPLRIRVRLREPAHRMDDRNMSFFVFLESMPAGRAWPVFSQAKAFEPNLLRDG